MGSIAVISIKLLIAIIWLHWLADFVLQTEDMATKKSKSNYYLTQHIAVYSVPFFISFGWRYALVNGAVHWLVDYVTSRINSKMWAAKEVHYFFVGVGLDQAIHLTTLVLTVGLIHP